MATHHLATMVLKRAERLGDAPAISSLVDGAWVRRSWREMGEDIMRYAAGLVALGVEPGQRVGLISRNRYEWLVMELAIFAVRAVSVPFSLKSASRTLERVLDVTKCALVVVESGAIIDASSQSWASCQGLRRVVVIEPFERPFPDVDAISLDEMLSLGQERGGREEVERRQRNPSPIHMATILLTQGSKGAPRAVVITHANMYSQINGLAAILQPTGRDTYLCHLPLDTAYERAMTYTMLNSGVPVAILHNPRKRLPDKLREVQPTITTIKPSHAEGIVRKYSARGEHGTYGPRGIYRWARRAAKERIDRALVGYDDSLPHRLRGLVSELVVFRRMRAELGGRLRLIVCAGGPLRAKIARVFHEVGLPLLHGYGLAEASGFVACNSKARFKPGTVGQCLPNSTVRIADDGEILVSGPNVMLKYLDEPEDTEETVVGGWLHTGDIGSKDEDGYLTIQGRKQDIIQTTQGARIAPSTIEALLVASPLVDFAVVIGDGRAAPLALVVPNRKRLGRWLKKERGVTLDDDDALLTRAMATHAEALLWKVIRKVNRSLDEEERLAAVVALPRRLSVEDGEVTRDGKPRRAIVTESFTDIIDEAYDRYLELEDEENEED